MEVATYLYIYLCREIDRLTRALCRGAGQRSRDSFRLGAVAAVRETLTARGGQKVPDGEEGLVKQRLDDVRVWAEAHLRLRSARKARRGMLDRASYAAGQTAGTGIAIRGGVSGASIVLKQLK